MRKFNISIPKPCAENWNNFTPTSDGGFCSACSKTVTDFTKMNDEEVASFLCNHASANVCGRFNASQLKPYHETTWVNPGVMFLKAGFASLLCLLMLNQVSAQTLDTKVKTENVQGEVSKEKNTTGEYVVKGLVKSEDDHQTLPGANVLLQGTSEGTNTDAEGRFQFPRKLKEGDILVFTFVGFEPQQYTVTSNTSLPLEITMIVAPEIMMGAVSSDVYHPKQSGFQKAWRKLKNAF
jgi:hypothetical protein